MFKNFLLLSDIHGDLEQLNKLDDEFAKADAVLFAGDFAKFEHAETGLPVLQNLCKKHDTVFAVIGNCDEPDFLEQLDQHDVSVEKNVVYASGFVFSGSGGTIKFTGTTPNERTDEELLSDLELASHSQDYSNMILILHHPPFETECDKLTNGVHVGSKLFREFIETKQPLLVNCGHIHESKGYSKIGETLVVNPGSLAEGYYATCVIEKIDDKFTVKSVELKNTEGQ